MAEDRNAIVDIFQLALQTRKAIDFNRNRQINFSNVASEEMVCPDGNSSYKASVGIDEGIP